MLEELPLEQAPAILTAEITRDGPRICEALVRALADEEDLKRLEAGGALEPLVARIGELAGVGAPDAVSAAVETLAAVIWSAIKADLDDGDSEQVAQLAERLAYVAELARGAALRRSSGNQLTQPLSRPQAVPSPPPVPAATRGRAARAVPEVEPSAAVSGDALWIGAVEDEIAKAREADTPLSLLLIELEDAERVEAAEGVQAGGTFSRFAHALRAVVRRRDILASETDTRAWIIARETGRVGAQALASRAASVIREAHGWQGGPMTVNAGVAVLSEDGRDAASLIEAAEEARYAAAAAGVAVLHELPPEGNGPQLVS